MDKNMVRKEVLHTRNNMSNELRKLKDKDVKDNQGGKEK